MTDFWNHWWLLSAWLTVPFSLAWIVWTLATLPAVAGVRARTSVTLAERSWLRTVGRCVRREAPNWLADPVEGAYTRALHNRYGEDVREAHRANIARFLIPATLGGLTAVAGIAQYVFTFVALAGHTTGWLAVSAVMAILSLVPAYVTVVTSRRVWLKRQPFAWRVYVAISNVLMESARHRGAERIEASLDRIEAAILGRYEESATELPSHRNAALRWNTDAYPVLLARPRWSGVNDNWSAARSWVDLCAALALDTPQIRTTTRLFTSDEVLPVRGATSPSFWIPLCIGLPVVFVGDVLLIAGTAPRTPHPQTLDRVQEFFRDPLVPNVVGVVGLLVAVLTLATTILKPGRNG